MNIIKRIVRKVKKYKRERIMKKRDKTSKSYPKERPREWEKWEKWPYRDGEGTGDENKIIFGDGSPPPTGVLNSGIGPLHDECPECEYRELHYDYDTHLYHCARCGYSSQRCPQKNPPPATITDFYDDLKES